MLHRDSAAKRKSSGNRSTRRQTAGGGPEHPVLDLQQQIGNSEMARMLNQSEPASEGFASGAAPSLTGSSHALPGADGSTESIGPSGGAVSSRIANEISSRQGQGSPLDDATRESMESRVGTGLGDVRVHTDAEANTLSRNLNANAFTVGSDVFFRSGAYAPGSSSGRTLIGHELAHVLQQRSMTAAGPMRVTSANDMNERAADSVAARFVSPIGSSPGPLSRPPSARSRSASPVIQRAPSNDLNEMANAGGDQAARDQAEERRVNQEPPIMKVSNISDVSAAQELANNLKSWRPEMIEGAGAGGAFKVSSGRVTAEKIDANEVAIATLDDYLMTAGQQTQTLGSFQGQMQKSRVDYERLKAQVTHLTVTNAIAGGTAGEMGEQIVQNAGFQDSYAAQQEMQKREPQGQMPAEHNDVQKAHQDLVAASQQVGGKQAAVQAATYDYQSALNNFERGVPSVNDNPDQAKELTELKEKIETIKKWVGIGLEAAGKVAEMAGVEGAEKAVEPAKKVAEFLTDAAYDNQMNEIKAKIGLWNAAHREHAITADLDKVRAAQIRFTQSLREFNQTQEAFATAQKTFRDALQLYGRVADGGKGDKFAQIASVLAEVDTYEAQLDATISLGYQEQSAGATAASARKTAEGGPGAAGQPRQAGQVYYEPYKFFHANGGWGYECSRQELHINSLGTSRGSAEGVANVGINATVDEAIKMLQEYRKEVDPMRQALAKALDLRMDNTMPAPDAGPAPTARAANQGL